MTQWLINLCFGSGILLAFMQWLLRRMKRGEARTEAISRGVQALLRDRLLQSYEFHSAQGYCGVSERDNWMNMYQWYHALGSNGVMDDIEKKFMALPTEPSKED